MVAITGIGTTQLAHATTGGVDFHLHTRSSDGLLDDRQLIDALRSHDVSVAAITNHDDISVGRDPVVTRYLDALGNDAPRIVPGVEITCWLDTPVDPDGWQPLHMIGLGVDPNDPRLRKALIRQRLGRIAWVDDCIAKLRADGFDVRSSELGRVARGRQIAMNILAELLVQKGYAASKKLAMSELVEPRAAMPGDIPERFTLSPKEAIELIHAVGGVAILAHPHRNVPSHDPLRITRLFEDLEAKGLDAVEIYRADLDNDKEPIYAACAKAVGLLPSGGSDYHAVDQNGSGRHPGDAFVPASVWPALQQRIVARGGYTDLRDVRVGAAPDGNAAERLRIS